MQALLMDLLGAGHDTTANLVNFALASILEYPNQSELLHQLQQEIEPIAPLLDKYSQLDREGTRTVLDHIEHRMPLLNDVMRETLRLYPLGAAFSRVNVREATLAGHVIPANTKLLISPYVLGRLTYYWGKDANQFNPYRWRSSSSSITNDKNNSKSSTITNGEGGINMKAYIPFGGGARGCLGGRFGMLEAKLVVMRVLQRCQMTKQVQTQNKKLDSILAFTLRSRNPVLVDVEMPQK